MSTLRQRLADYNRRRRNGRRSAMTPQDRAAMQLRVAAIELNAHIGPDRTADHLRHLSGLFETNATFRQVAREQYNKRQEGSA